MTPAHTGRGVSLEGKWGRREANGRVLLLLSLGCLGSGLRSLLD